RRRYKTPKEVHVCRIQCCGGPGIRCGVVFPVHPPGWSIEAVGSGSAEIVFVAMSTPSLLDQIREVHDSRESGVLTLSSNGHRVQVFYREGMIQAATSHLPSHRLGDYLIKAGYLTDRDTHTVLKTAQKNRTLFGETAVRRRHLDAPELAEVVRQQSIGLLQH